MGIASAVFNKMDNVNTPNIMGPDYYTLFALKTKEHVYFFPVILPIHFEWSISMKVRDMWIDLFEQSVQIIKSKKKKS